ncbi:hypothetical protein V1511DRAFT_489026 [Dipodascopsis uninucleata]
MVPDSVDERVLEEHLLRDTFYNFDYTSLSTSVVSAARSGASSLHPIHPNLGYAYDLVLSVIVLLVLGGFVYVIIRALMLVKRKTQQQETPLLPVSASYPSSTTTSPMISSSSTFSPLGYSSSCGAKEKCDKKSFGVLLLDKLLAVVQNDDRERRED